MSDYARSDLDIYFFSMLVPSNEEQHSTTITAQCHLSLRVFPIMRNVLSDIKLLVRKRKNDR